MEYNQEILKIYFAEAIGNLNKISDSLINLSRNGKDDEAFNKVMLCAHNLKGTSLVMGFVEVGQSSGELEDRLKIIKKTQANIQETISKIKLKVKSIETMVREL